MWGEYLRLAWRALSAYRLRSALTVLSITIGVFAIILLVSIGQSANATLSKGVEELGGSRFIMLWEDSAKKAAKKAGLYRKGLTRGDARALGERLPGVEAISAVKTWDDGMTARLVGGPELQTDRIGTDSRYARVFGMRLREGRFLSEDDLAQRRHVVVLGDALARNLAGENALLGDEVVLKGERFRVIGIMAPARRGPMSFGWSWDDSACVPLTVLDPTGRASLLAMRRTADAPVERLLDRANAVLLHRHNGVDDFQLFDLGGMIKGYQATFTAMLVVVGLIAGMSLVIGGVGIMNIMLVAVSERRREIGLRIAVGAPRGSVRLQFLVEATLLSLSGAALGALLGTVSVLAAVVVVPRINPDWLAVMSWPAVATAILAAGFTGVFFGWYPARQASRLDPIVCLRTE
ncbi:MAG: ABC transporter permease [bacterium]|nr:ABC transporter permease [bacterium]